MYYIGKREEGYWEAFRDDREPRRVTPEDTGYLRIEGPFSTLMEAEETAEANN